MNVRAALFVLSALGLVCGFALFVWYLVLMARATDDPPERRRRLLRSIGGLILAMLAVAVLVPTAPWPLPRPGPLFGLFLGLLFCVNALLSWWEWRKHRRRPVAALLGARPQTRGRLLAFMIVLNLLLAVSEFVLYFVDF